MVDYCSQSEIKDNLKGFELQSDTTITPEILSEIISEESAVIDQHVQSRYTLPITDATSLLFLKKICIDLGVYRVTKILQPRQAVQTPAGPVMQEISNSSAYREAMRMLKDLMKGNTTLPGEEERALTFVSSTAVDCDHKTNFKYEEQQW